MNHFSVEQHVLYQIRNADKKSYPFPHFYVRNVFPDAFYTRLTDELAAKTDFKGEEGRYHGRTFSTIEGLNGLDFIKTQPFVDAVLSVFAKEMHKRYAGAPANLYTDLRMVRDGINYEIGPHTDAPWKLVSLLFYLPSTSKYDQYGTSIYVPKEPGFRCAGGPHHPFDQFHRVATVPYVRNAAFCFWKNDVSFHGVEPVTVNFQRDVLLYNIYCKDEFDRYHKPKQQSEPL